MKKIIIFVWLLFGCGCVNADDLILGQYTRHAERFYDSACYDSVKKDCQFGDINDIHPLIGLNADGYTVFVMKNSFDRTSFGVLRTFEYSYTANIKPYLSFGLVSGYKDALPVEWNGIAPVVYTGLDLHPSSDKWGVVISYAPQQFIGIGLRFKIGN